MLSSTRWQRNAALPADSCAFGDWFGTVFRPGESSIEKSIHPSAQLELVVFSACRGFASHSAPIKVLPFQGTLCIHHADF
jgi:hypothetical protein